MHPEILHTEEVYFKGAILYGISVSGSLLNMPIKTLWQNYKAQWQGERPKSLINLQRYPTGYHKAFNPATPYEQWAGTFNQSAIDQPSTLAVPSGKYLKLLRRGNPNDGRVFEYLFTQLLPAKGYTVDDRPHFEVLGENYSQMAEIAEEEIWIPIVDH